MDNFGTISNLNPLSPDNNDLILEGDDHIRGIKQTLKATFPGFKGVLNPKVTQTFLNSLADSIHINSQGVVFVKPVKFSGGDVLLDNSQIAGVRAGTDDQDAVNKAQLEELLTRIKALEDKI